MQSSTSSLLFCLCFIYSCCETHILSLLGCWAKNAKTWIFPHKKRIKVVIFYFSNSSRWDEPTISTKIWHKTNIKCDFFLNKNKTEKKTSVFFSLFFPGKLGVGIVLCQVVFMSFRIRVETPANINVSNIYILTLIRPA